MDNNLKTWGDLASNYNLILFNNCVNITNKDEDSILYEWQENHTCEALEAGSHIDNCEIENCKKCKEYKEDFGEYPECECEPYQWYIININEADHEYLNREFKLDIFYSSFLDLYILPVYHFGTSWDMLNLKGGYATEKK